MTFWSLSGLEELYPSDPLEEEQQTQEPYQEFFNSQKKRKKPNNTRNQKKLKNAKHKKNEAKKGNTRTERITRTKSVPIKTENQKKIINGNEKKNINGKIKPKKKNKKNQNSPLQLDRKQISMIARLDLLREKEEKAEKEAPLQSNFIEDDDPNKIIVKVNGLGLKGLKFRIFKNSPFGLLMDIFCQKRNLPRERIQFFCEDLTVSPEDSPETVFLGETKKVLIAGLI
ncbi:small ubiquitin-related modifier [Anaeramoeba ignava]|uniref:Small ubiquitin-related modifier n=1 Tax=Anaeramoeba ignava TaxID=1746090 RepID=A0A9Q0LNJ4_ANAIG|nr:small ubiquitin-related modifier [Anaeramoeba ignava]